MIGLPVLLRGEPHTIVGVMPSGFEADGRADLWTPLRPSVTGEGGGANYTIVARLRPGVEWAEADSQIRIVGATVVRQMNLSEGFSAEMRLVPRQYGMTQYVRTPLLILLGAVGAVLLIGCVNIASLLLARAAGRSREIATRLAIGGGRAAIVRQLFTESLLLAGLGGLAGVALGYFGVQGLKAAVRSGLGVSQTISLDLRLLAAIIGLCFLTSLLFGLFPALQATRMDVRTALTKGGRGVAGARSRWPRRLLVIGEVALGFGLLFSAGVLIRTFAHLRGLQPGFDPSGVVVANVALQDARYTTSDAVNRLFDQTLEQIQGLPGVESAAVSLSVPYVRWLNMRFRCWMARPARMAGK